MLGPDFFGQDTADMIQPVSVEDFNSERRVFHGKSSSCGDKNGNFSLVLRRKFK